MEGASGSFIELISSKIYVESDAINMKIDSQEYNVLFLLFQVDTVILDFKMPVKITQCSFISNETATPIEIEMDVAEFRGSEYFEGQLISELFKSSINQCRVKSITLDGSGADIVTYDE